MALAAATPAMAQTFSQTVFFGDSLTDSGHYRPALVEAGGPSAAILGKFTTNPGLVWAEYLADFYGAAAHSANQGGTNYAVGGAMVATDRSGALGPTPSLATQVGNYLSTTGGRADANALYTLWGGANDIFAVTAGAPAEQTIGAAVSAQIGLVGSLQAAGARYILVPTIPDIGGTPGFLAQGAQASAIGTQLSTAYNDALFGGLAASGLRVIPLDTFHLLQEISANPGAYGFSNVTGTACQPQITAQSITCHPGTYVSPDADRTHVFADGVHPTSSAHAVLAQYAVSVIEAPRLAAVMPHVEAQTGRNRADRVAAQVVGRTQDSGMRLWADVRGDYQKFDDGAGLMVDGEGAGPALSVGLDWRSGNLVYGGFLGHGRQKLDFGRHHGDISIDDTALGGYLGWRNGQAWVTGQVGYSWSSHDFDRKIVLGDATRLHRGSADGSNLTVALDAGYEFARGTTRHGPVLSLVSQRIKIDEMREDQPSLATSLAYPERDVDSLVGRLGWQARFNVDGHISPYARLTWDREFEDADEEVFARLQSLPASAPYAVPGLSIDKDYGTLVFGARSRLFGMDADIGLTGTVARNGQDAVSLFASLGRGF
ncbi:autotransporter domain-containing protein [Lysobacter alkalisoli]|uniref:Autotransporter domain-containing protein n=2 Tax=Marilutibacter alkalisoli TaxID=2591633 RepID=A0A514BWK0_9GAMM|nr:autotransporter domain-containing protein [Lysobacter alkalisoli]